MSEGIGTSGGIGSTANGVGRWTRGYRLAVALLAGVGAVAIGVPLASGLASGAVSYPHLTAAPASGPAYSGDAPDPDVVYADGTYYAFTTGTTLGNNLQVLIDQSGDVRSGWHPYTGGYGSTALANPPGWQQVGTETSPGVAYLGGHWVMWYDASRAGHGVDTGFSCLAVATATTITPTDPQFTDTSADSPWCPPGGVLDPSPFVDPTTGAGYLVWKTNDGTSGAPSQIWGVQLDQDGTGFTGSPTLLLTVTVAEKTTDNPQLVFADGGYHLLFSGGNFEDSSYNEQLADCAGPLGPCANPPGPFLTTSGAGFGPGGGTLVQDPWGNGWLAYAGWNEPCTSCTGTAGAIRQLFVAPVDQATGPPPVEFAGVASLPGGNGYWLVDSTGVVRPHGAAVSYGSMAGQPLNAPISHIVATSDGKGYWLVAADGGTFAFGDAGFYGSMGGQHLNAPVVDLAPTADGRGYWLVASDGGIFAFGDAGFYGSMGGRPLNQPVVGLSGDPATGGYWLVATDGGIFAFGAPFLGSMGSVPLNRPINGMAVTANGQGYGFVASDGGMFTFGDFAFHGSAGSLSLVAPVTGMAPDLANGGYWLVGADGGIFSYGAPFYGAD
ncbi:MAG TPA: family 43 glycosylhydrolase [Acidimicrobiales bacterium]